MSRSLKATVLTDLTSEINEMGVKDEVSSRDDEFEEKFNPDIPPTQTPSIVDEIEIKHEKVGHQSNNSYSDTGSGDNVDENDLDKIFLDGLHCDRACEGCIKLLKMLSAHVRATHGPPPPFQVIQDPELIDPLHIDPDAHNAHQSSPIGIAIGIKSESVETVEEMECAEEESERNSKLSDRKEIEWESVNDPDPDYTPPVSQHLTQNIRRQDLTKKNVSSDIKISEARKGFLSSQKEFKCDVCNRRFSTKGRLNIHNRIHTGHRPYQCVECVKSFTRPGSLTKHMFVHTGEKPHSCTECEQSFSHRTQLSRHMVSHTGKKPFKCEECEKSFSLRSDLNDHKRMHTAEKPWRCTVCDKCFKRSSELTRHRKMRQQKCVD